MEQRSLKADHRHITIQMVAGFTFTLIFLGLGYSFFHIDNVSTFAQRMALTIHWGSMLALIVLLSILDVGIRRYRGSEARRDGVITDRLRIPIACLTNTIEQSFAAILVYLGLAITLPETALQLIPLMVILFTIGRICFYVGYTIKPIWRAFGFSMSMLPTTVGCFYVIFHF